METPSAWKTYFKVFVGLIPTLGLWVFSLMVIFPRIELLVKRTGLDAKESSILKFIIELSRFTHSNFYLIALALGIALFVLEQKVESWDRLRQPVCTWLAVLLNTVVMLGLAASAVIASLAASVLLRPQ